MKKDLKERIETLAKLLFKSRYPVFFTGAGISTESGLPDFRGPDGMWTRRDKGLAPKPGRPWDSVGPNSGHMALAELQKMGKLKFLISQNVDNLHLKSGIRPDLLAELHGNLNKLRCLRCGETYEKSSGKSTCPCGGTLTSSVVDFGQSLPEKDLFLSYEYSRKSDLFVVVGSSLVVTPAADMPREALHAGAKLVIINRESTNCDSLADIVINNSAGPTMAAVVAEVQRIMSDR